MSAKFKKEVVTKVFKQKTVHELKLPHESFLFWRFDFNRAKTCVKSQLVPLNQKSPNLAFPHLTHIIKKQSLH